MSILAEPRRKQRITVDPQNITWKQDNFGKSLLQRMGWSDGKGLGAHEQGSSENLRLKANFTNTGLGCDQKADNDGQWIAHHDDFASLLEQLNSKNSDSEKRSSVVEGEVSIQNTSKSQRKRIHYKFTRGKDLTLASTLHKDGIFGKNRHSKRSEISDVDVEQSAQMSSPNKDKEVEKEEVPDQKMEPPFTSQLMTVSTSSVADVYKEKMKKWLNRGLMGSAVTVEKKVEVEEVKTEVCVETWTEANTETEEDKAERKRLKKERKRLAALAAETAQNPDPVEADENIKVETPEEKAERKRLKRELKRLAEAEAAATQPAEVIEDDAEREERRRIRREKKAKKAMESAKVECPEEEPTKKKKKRDSN